MLKYRPAVSCANACTAGRANAATMAIAAVDLARTDMAAPFKRFGWAVTGLPPTATGFSCDHGYRQVTVVGDNYLGRLTTTILAGQGS
jgi:hypothetical protein